jgi:hypothetical protein
MRMLAFCVMLVLSLPGEAFVSDPELEPNPVLAGQTVHILLQTGGCDAVLGGDNPVITVVGQQVEVQIEGERNTDAWCFFPVVDHSFPITGLAPGEYVVNVFYWYQPLFGDIVTENLGGLPLSVLALPPQPVPAQGRIGLTVLIFILLIIGAISCTRRGY